MFGSQASAEIMECPDSGTLISFTLGKLPSPASETIAKHISTCQECQALLGELDKAHHDDAIVEDLRRCFEAQPLLEEPGCAILEAAAKDLSSATSAPPITEPMGRSSDSEPWVGRSVGNYQIVDLVGKGGMGMVFKARQVPVQRLVALKMIHAGAFAGPGALRRFRTEGQAIARLQHAHVVPIYEFGEMDGLPYFSMELMEGGSLSAKLSSSPLPPRQAAEMMVQLASALDFVHKCQVVHRDLKPGNILLTGAGVPKISDFGLAKLLDLDGDETRSEQIVGTPSYMAPEQTMGGKDGTSPAVDIYALGAVLYEALAGRPPFRGKKPDVLDQIRFDDPAPPSRHRPGVPPDLEAVCLKCLEKDPKNRYATAQALADDLQRWLDGEPTLARPLRWPGKAWRAVKRHKVRVGLAMLVPCVVAAFWLLRPVNHLPEIEEEIKQGKAVTLVPETGGPKWSAMVTGLDSSQAAVGADGAFSVHSWGLCLLELLPKTQHANYRITAQVRHEKSDLRGEVGLYVARDSYPGPRRYYQLFVHLAYNDVQGIFENLPEEITKKVKPRDRNFVGLSPHLYGERGDQFPLDRSPGTVSGAQFKASGWAGGPWRTLEITVTPAGVKAARDGTPVGELLSDSFKKALDEALSVARGRFPGDAFLAAVKAEFRPQGALGLYVYRGSASFKNVRFTPLR
jgi:hypothetical protein